MMNCDRQLLQASLDDRLSEAQEGQLVRHLECCSNCQAELERLAGDPQRWNRIQVALRKECDHRSSSLADRSPSAIPTDCDGLESGFVKPSDFIVDFLQPSETPNSLGRLGQIEIQQFIGQGAHGLVLKGLQVELNRLVAVKMMAPHLATIVAARKRFAREARATAAIVHPNVMPILQVDSSGQVPYLLMPYLDCQSLQQRLDKEGTLALEDVLRIAIQIARGLSAAHDQGVVHRDVKPANILLERGVERVMLTDFGLATVIDDASLTRSGLIAGTPHFMSPEQARGDSIDARSDLFSLGSVIYAMLVGRPPFRAETTYGILRRVTDEPHRPLRSFNNAIPIWLERVVNKLLSKDPAGRFRSASELAEVLQECLAHWLNPAQSKLPKQPSGSTTWLLGLRGLRSKAAWVGLVTLLAAVPSSLWLKKLFMEQSNVTQNGPNYDQGNGQSGYKPEQGSNGELFGTPARTSPLPEPSQPSTMGHGLPSGVEEQLMSIDRELGQLLEQLKSDIGEQP